MSDNTVLKLSQPSTFSDPLTEVLRSGARSLLARAVEAEVAAFLDGHSEARTEEGRRRLVRHGHLPEREIMTGIGPVAVRAPRVRDRTGQGADRIRFSSALLPPYARRSKSLEVLIPVLYLTSYDINDFDLYYQDIQQRIKDQRFPNRDLPRKGQEKIDVTIVVDMLLTGFDAAFLNTLYVDKNLRHHGLIQAFSRTNRVLNATKPYGNILDFRRQQDRVDDAIALFSGAQPDQAREIWLVDKAPVVVDGFKQAVDDLGRFMQSQGLEARPDRVNNLMGDEARVQFINRFKEVHRLQTQLDQYTDLTDAQREQIEQALSKDDLRAFRGAYLETAQRLKEQQGSPGGDGDPSNPEVDQLDFEFVLFASAVIDYDYIMKLIAKYSGQDPKKVQISREQLIGLIQSDAKFLDEREEITEYVRSLKEGEGLDEAAIRAGYEQFKAEKQAKEIADLAQAHGLTTLSLSAFVDTILQRMIFDGEQLTDLMEPLGFGWRERRRRELALMADLVPLLNKRAQGQEISGLNAYEHGGTR